MFSTIFGTNPLDDLIDKATSETLPSGQEDISLNLEISDQIRAKTFNCKDMLSSLRRRLRHSNPNVQLLALALADTCVKNGGNHFLVEVASREFMDDLVSILKHPGGINPQVKTKILECIQNWSETFKDRPELNYTCQIYTALKAQGYTFPPKEAISAAMIDTRTAPEWTDSEVCMRCRTAFTFTNRKHHCRNCGQTFCHTCSTNTIALPQFGITDPVRVCTGCYLGMKRVSNESTSLSLSEFISTERPPGNSSSTNGKAPQPRDDFDDDLRKAIELSLKEQQDQGSRNRYEPAPPAKIQPIPEVDEVDDPELAAAIAASLQDLNQVGRKVEHSYTNPYEYDSYKEPTRRVEVPDTNLSDREIQNLLLFTRLIDAIKANHGTIDPSIHALYAEISQLAPKLSLNLNLSTQKHGNFSDLQAKLAQAVKLYDSLLDQSLNKGQGFANQGSEYLPTYAPNAPASSNPYPTNYPDPASAYSYHQSTDPNQSYQPQSNHYQPTGPPTHNSYSNAVAPPLANPNHQSHNPYSTAGAPPISPSVNSHYASSDAPPAHNPYPNPAAAQPGYYYQPNQYQSPQQPTGYHDPNQTHSAPPQQPQQAPQEAPLIEL